MTLKNDKIVLIDFIKIPHTKSSRTEINTILISNERYLSILIPKEEETNKKPLLPPPKPRVIT